MEYREKSAVISECGKYRYRLTRGWDPSVLYPSPVYVNWVMCNPSTADAAEDDATIRRIVAYTEAWGYKRLIVTNLFALRSTQPLAIKRRPDPVGADNNNQIIETARYADMVVAAWGTWGYFGGRGERVTEMILDHTKRVFCLRKTFTVGHPVHPLQRSVSLGRVPKLIPWP